MQYYLVPLYAFIHYTPIFLAEEKLEEKKGDIMMDSRLCL